MLRSTLEMKNYVIGATDGEIGHVTDFFFDDETWVIRYLVVETGSWLASRKVLISPFSLMQADWMHKRLPVRITRNQVKNSPDIDTHKPVSRQHEVMYADYYGHPYYWGGAGLWGEGLYFPDPMSRDAISYAQAGSAQKARHFSDDPHLRSCQAVIGYHIHASDGNLGHVQGMLVDEENWAIRYMIVDTSNYWLGHQVLISPDWVTAINWSESTVTIDLLQQTIKDSPRFDATSVLNREQELAIYRHYDRANYWEKERQPGLIDALE